MKVYETIKALRWIAKNDEIVFNAEMANDAAEIINDLRAENDFLKARNVWIANKLRGMSISTKKNEEIRREILDELEV